LSVFLVRNCGLSDLVLNKQTLLINNLVFLILVYADDFESK